MTYGSKMVYRPSNTEEENTEILRLLDWAKYFKKLAFTSLIAAIILAFFGGWYFWFAMFLYIILRLISLGYKKQAEAIGG